MTALDKARSNMPEKPLPPKKTGAIADDDMEMNKVVRGGVTKPASGKNAPKGKVSLAVIYM
jgi:hypothetical protein